MGACVGVLGLIRRTIPTVRPMRQPLTNKSIMPRLFMAVGSLTDSVRASLGCRYWWASTPRSFSTWMPPRTSSSRSPRPSVSCTHAAGRPVQSSVEAPVSLLRGIGAFASAPLISRLGCVYGLLLLPPFFVAAGWHYWHLDIEDGGHDVVGNATLHSETHMQGPRVDDDSLLAVMVSCRQMATRACRIKARQAAVRRA